MRTVLCKFRFQQPQVIFGSCTVHNKYCYTLHPHKKEAIMDANLCFSEYGQSPFQSRKSFPEFPFSFRGNGRRKQNTKTGIIKCDSRPTLPSAWQSKATLPFGRYAMAVNKNQIQTIQMIIFFLMSRYILE